MRQPYCKNSKVLGNFLDLLAITIAVRPRNGWSGLVNRRPLFYQMAKSTKRSFSPKMRSSSRNVQMLIAKVEQYLTQW